MCGYLFLHNYCACWYQYLFLGWKLCILNECAFACMYLCAQVQVSFLLYEQTSVSGHMRLCVYLGHVHTCVVSVFVLECWDEFMCDQALFVS